MSVVNKNVVVLLQEILQVSLGVPQSRYVEVVLVFYVDIDEFSCSSGVTPWALKPNLLQWGVLGQELM